MCVCVCVTDANRFSARVQAIVKDAVDKGRSEP